MEEIQSKTEAQLIIPDSIGVNELKEVSFITIKYKNNQYL